MSGQLAPPIAFLAVGPYGPVPGGLLYTYAAGTSLPQATYTDSTLTTANTNPVVMDATGQASVWLSPALSYKFVLTDAAGNTLRTQDNINGFISAPLIGSNLVPSVNNTYTLGTSTDAWAQLYLGPNGAPAFDPVSGNIGFIARTPSEIAANVTPTDYTYAEGNVLRYGADNTGTIDCYTAIQKALSVACAASSTSGYGNHAFVYFPHGLYNLATQSAFANPLGQTGNVKRGILVYGDGMGASQINIADTIWLLLGSTNEQNWIELTFQNLYFAGNPVTQLANGFQWYFSQGLRFYNCLFGYITTVFSQNGGVTGTNGDGLRCVCCRFFSITSRVMVLNNANSLNNDFYGCEAEGITGDVFQVTSGGALRWFGGSIIMAANAGAINTYLLHINASANGLGFNNNTFSFYGMQTQIGQHSPLPQLFYGLQNGDGAQVLFDGCNLTEQAGSARQTVTNFGHTITFRRCVLTQNQGCTYYNVGNQTGDGWASPGSITFDNCIVPPALSTYISNQADSGDSLIWGMVRAINCNSGGDNTTDARNIRYAMDFDINWQNNGRSGFAPRLKVVSGYVPNRQMPDSAGNTWQINLPNGAVIIKILAFRAATTGATAYTLQVGTTTNATLYGSTAGTIGASQTVSVDWLDTPSSWVVTPNTSTGSYPAAGNTVVMSASTTATGSAAAGISNNSIFQVWYY